MRLGEVTLTGRTEPFGMFGCQGIGPASLAQLVGRVVDRISVVEGEYVAIDSGENRLAFPIDGTPAGGVESVRLDRPADEGRGIPGAHWTW